MNENVTDIALSHRGAHGVRPHGRGGVAEQGAWACGVWARIIRMIYPTYLEQLRYNP